MKHNSAIYFSVAGLISIVLIQLGGIFYAYHAQMREAEESLNKCFWMAFTETVDNVVNNLPYPDGTVVGLSYGPNPHKVRLDQNEYNKLGAQQMAWTLQAVYGVKEIPLATMDSVLHNKMRRAGLKGRVAVELFNVKTDEVLESTAPVIHAGFATITSEPAFTFKPRGEAFRAIVVFPFGEIGRNILILSGVTFLFLAIAVFTLIIQIKSVMSQRHSLQKQQQDFYTLAEEMRLPVTGLLSEMEKESWNQIEEKSAVLLGMTERTLFEAKAEVQRGQNRKHFSYKIVSLFCLVGVFLLLGIWSGYLYYIGYQKMKLHVEEHFEDAFYYETVYHRFKKFRKFYPRYGEEDALVIPTPYIRRFYEEFRKLHREKGYHYYINRVLVYHLYNNFDENFRMHAAYALQDTINHHAKVPVPFSLHYADSAFNAGLSSGGYACKGDIHWKKNPSGTFIHYSGSPETGHWDMTTKVIPLREDSLTYIQGIVRSPQRYIVRSVWYMLLPLGITFLFVCSCVFFLIKMLRMQRRLKQFQKDFTYSMIHDMKSPLQSIIMGAHILASGRLTGKPEKSGKYRQAMADECEHLLMLSNRVVMLTQLDRGELQLQKERVILKPLFEDMTEKFLLKATKNVHFQIVCDESCAVWADIFCLREVLSNLIDNAIKYSDEEVEITLLAEQTLSGLFIKVRDNGIGIPLHEQHKIFAKFERISSASRQTGASGFGLGLNYVIRVVSAHGGTVNVESIEGSYSEFTLQFPLLADSCSGN